jgi:hypothetical protein
MNLLTIERTLEDLYDLKQELSDQPAFDEMQVKDRLLAIEQADLAIKEYLQKEVQKVDNVARFRRGLDHCLDATKKEIELLRHRQEQLQKWREEMDAMVLDVMRAADKKKLEGGSHTLRRQGNGGVQAVEVLQPELVPEGLKRYSLTMRGDLYHWLWSVVTEFEKEHAIHPLAHSVFDDAHSVFDDAKTEPDLTAIREALEARERCPACGGLMRVAVCDCEGGSNPEWHDCDTCNGEGTIPAGVPGCRLVPRGEHLRVS